ncbi:hypothetical protein SmJEL517_g00185 [Synchytrium microbalum]|uniref:AB hydrolase-1 domain-containing protein n=1 Tax=Synchytrium microbalum TaxID=1806994 RepID=A0A507CF95_9FUNG|nr:uncharacterized protein SmJEL517_g00185 [Synchytrium microbalum]TPX38171.1 hypothetical protein SmJEL517_g00185 [Synchytrium microbalum]
MAASAALPTIFEDKTPHTFSNGGGQIVYEDSGETGNDKVILCLPGIGDIRQSYRFLAPKLRQAGYRVLVSELRASGDSKSAGFTDFRPEDSASDALAVLAAAGVSHATIVCNSFTGASSFYIAGTHADKVDAIICLGGIVRDQSADTYFRPISHLLFNSLWGASSWVGYWKSLFKKTPPSDLETQANAIFQNLKKDAGQIAALGKMVRATKNNCFAVASKITAPVLLVVGTADPDFANPLKEMEDVSKSLTSSRKVEIKSMEGLGHYCHVEAPEIVGEFILGFLKDLQ